MGKQNNYDHSLRVPIIVKGPGIPRGQKRNVLCYLHEIYPTLCELAGIELPESAADGNSLVPSLRYPDRGHRDVLHFAYKDVQRSVRDSRFKLIEYVVNGTHSTQLFDMGADPDELINLAERTEYLPHVSRLRGEVKKWREDMGDTRELGDRFWSDY